MTEKVDAICSEFAFVDTVLTIGDSIYGVFNAVAGGTVPYIEIDISSAGKKYHYGDSVIVLDMRWYAQYKPYVDTVLSAMIWIFFFWRLFVHLPGIISGMSGFGDHQTQIVDLPYVPHSGYQLRLEDKSGKKSSRR